MIYQNGIKLCSKVRFALTVFVRVIYLAASNIEDGDLSRGDIEGNFTDTRGARLEVTNMRSQGWGNKESYTMML